MSCPVRLALHGAVLSLLLAAGLPAAGQQAAEPVVKAGFVYNFAKFIEWPPAAMPAGQPVQLCLTGTDAQALVAAVFEGKVLQGRALAVRRQVRPEELRGCHIVYVTETDERRQSEVLRALRGQPVLTVGDGEGFAEVGGMIGLLVEGGRVQFEVNTEVASAAGLKISSQLLRLARQVRGRS